MQHAISQICEILKTRDHVVFISFHKPSIGLFHWYLHQALRVSTVKRMGVVNKYDEKIISTL